ncbi:hypothetical protein DRN97_12665 [Methanosarcinales archaeon]|nr:MAG: hypothetical protein DRN97_12665 [Methanosarcinales archaeon]
MKTALFVGCTIPKRAIGYEISSRQVLDGLGIEYHDVQEFLCCGFPLKAASLDASLFVALRNLALAEM